MGRIILGVVVGFITMFAIVFVSMTGAWFALGVDKVFKPGVYDVSTMWLVVTVAVGIVAGIIGGIICKFIGRSPKSTFALAALVLILGAVSAIPAFMNKPTDAQRPAEVAMTEAMKNVKEPIWLAIANPILGIVGVVIGGSLVGRSSKPKLPAA